MEGSSVVMMVIGMVVIWGGLVASVGYAIRTGRQARKADTDR
ncbi:MAG TPA: methionine/alanine import family NSS transporter small subunit [Egibacteraceae bacterium]|nr:methionine/alanine import family NSS transporter small subunit [Egibacteraceae bacterium]